MLGSTRYCRWLVVFAAVLLCLVVALGGTSRRMILAAETAAAGPVHHGHFEHGPRPTPPAYNVAAFCIKYEQLQSLTMAISESAVDDCRTAVQLGLEWVQLHQVCLSAPNQLLTLQANAVRWQI